MVIDSAMRVCKCSRDGMMYNLTGTCAFINFEEGFMADVEGFEAPRCVVK
jgi:hypothetical protein